MSKVKSGRDRLVDIKIGTRLKLLRQKFKMSQEKLGNTVHVSFQQIQKYENGVNRISATRLQQFSRIFDVPMDYFFECDSDIFNVAYDKKAIATLWEKLPNANMKMGVFILMNSMSKGKKTVKKIAANG